LRKNSTENDKLVAGVKKRLYELIVEFMQTRPNHVATYLPQIRETCVRTLSGDPSSLVKEASVQLLLQMVEHYPLGVLVKVFDPKEMLNRLLDEIKLRKPSASVRGAIWHLIGLCHKRFKVDIREFLVESQDQMYRELKSQLDRDRPEFRAIVGIIKGLSASLFDECTLEEDEVEGLFIRVKTGMQPMADVKHKGIQKQSMKLFSNHVELFKAVIPKHAEPMVRLTLQLCVDGNLEVRDAASDMLGRLMQVISDGLTVDESIHKDIFREIVAQFQKILEAPDGNVQLISAIKAIGVFSRAIRTFMSEEMLLAYLDRLIELSEAKLIKEFEQQKDPDEDVQNFKYILKKQKQLISYIESYSHMLLELSQSPSERVLAHFFKVCTIGIANHRKLYDKYKHRFYEALASLVMSLSCHHAAFAQWVRKFVRHTLQETLKIPDAAIFGGESPEESLKDAIQFWREWLNKDQIWSSRSSRLVYDDLLRAIIEDIEGLNLKYEAKAAGHRGEHSGLPEEGKEGAGAAESSGLLVYQAHNDSHQQYLKRVADFLEVFVPQCHDEWLLKWVPRFSEVLIRKAIETPRIPRIYQVLRTLMQACSKHRYFERIGAGKTDEQMSEGEELNSEDARRAGHGPAGELEASESLDVGEKANVFNRLLSFFKDLIAKAEEYQDELLLGCIDLLLQVPLALLYSKDIGTDNAELWKGVMLKALELGHTDNGIAMTCVDMLEQWFNRLPPSTTVKLYQEILPQLSDFLNVEAEAQSDAPEYFHQRVLRQEAEVGKANITRKDISNKVLDLLGKIGGFAHNIINNELSKKHDKKNFIRWDPEKRLKFSLPLYNRKVDVYLDSCLPRIVELAQNSNKKDIRIAACEFLHSLIIFMIGKNAQQPKKQNRRGGGGAGAPSHDEMAAFAKLYAKLFPVIIKLATDAELIPRQLFEPLCFQIVRWFSSSKVYEHPEVESLLDSLVEGAQNKNNTSLRQLCSNAVAEFAKWSLKQMTDKEVEENPANIKSLVRRIESNANHPDPFKRLSSVLCFNKVFAVIRESDPLVDRFCLEICYSVLQSLKMCYDQQEQAREVIEAGAKLLPKIEKVILRKWPLLLQANSARGIVPDLQTLLLFAFERFKSFETVYRREATRLWENLVTRSPPSANPKTRMPTELKAWIKEHYCGVRKDRSILRQVQEIDFGPEASAGEGAREQKQDESLRKSKLLQLKKKFDQLTAQLEFMEWLLTKGKFSLAEL
jgi:DNA-dependent protein kinase catalytic subunit